MVTAPAPSRRYSIDDLDQFPDDGRPRDLVDGRIVEWDVPNFNHSFFVIVLARIISSYALSQRLGVVVGGKYMVQIAGSRFHARGADIAFYRRGRIPREKRVAASAVVPDLVIELVSPSDRAVDVQEKIRDWLRAGVRLLWCVDPESGLTEVHQADRVAYVEADETLTGADVMPSFALRMRDVLDELAAMEEEAGEGEPPAPEIG